MIRARSGFYDVPTDGGVLRCTLRKRVKRQLLTENGKLRYADPVAVGDRVRVEVIDEETGVIEEIYPRETKFSRKLPGRADVEQIVIANADQMVAMASIREPFLNERLLDRFLILADVGGLDSIICVNKMDLMRAEDQDEVREILTIYEKLGYPIVKTSVVTGQGISGLQELLRDKITFVVGASGVGKSSVLNAIQPQLGLSVGAISQKTQKGRHTTTYVEMFPLDVGGYVADTPGVREMHLWGIELEWLDAFFPEIDPYVDDCRFPDCTHTHEPDCAVKQAVQDDHISRRRYESYVRLRLGEQEPGRTH